MVVDTDNDGANGICDTCKGKATYAKSKVTVDGQATIEVIFCENCDGTGMDDSDGDVD